MTPSPIVTANDNRNHFENLKNKSLWATQQLQNRQTTTATTTTTTIKCLGIHLIHIQAQHPLVPQAGLKAIKVASMQSSCKHPARAAAIIAARNTQID